MKTLAISKFKAQALGVLQRVAETGENVIVTKRGKPLAQIVPYVDHSARQVPGRLGHTLVSMGDIVTPLGAEIWDAHKKGRRATG